MYRNLIIFSIALILIIPVSGGIVLFTPGYDSVSSTTVFEFANGRNDTIILATANGRCEYNGTWNIFHMNHENPPAGTLGEFVRAIEYDYSGNLWIGYSNGLQIWSGTGYKTIEDPGIMKKIIINDLQRRDNEMWVATGDIGLHVHKSNSWQWFRPYGPEGLDAYTIRNLAIDYMTQDLYAFSEDNGLWVLNQTTTGYSFKKPDEVCCPDCLDGSGDPMGGIYLFNRTQVMHLDSEGECRMILGCGDLPEKIQEILDISPAIHGGLVIGTDNGLVFWNNGSPEVHITKGDGIGDRRVETVFVDRAGRWWFATRNAVGYYIGEEGERLLPVQRSSLSCTPDPTNIFPDEKTGIDPGIPDDTPLMEQSEGAPDFFAGIFNKILEFFRRILTKN